MSEKLVIRGKKDQSRHEGKASEVRRLQETDSQLHGYYDGVDVIPRNQLNHQDNLNHLHGAYYGGEYYHHGVPQPRKK